MLRFNKSTIEIKMNAMIKIVVIAFSGILLLGACSKDSIGGFTARTFTVPDNLATRILNTSDSFRDQSQILARDNIARDYLKSISFTLPNETLVDGYNVYSFNGDKPNPNNRIFVITTYELNPRTDASISPNISEAHIFVGILPSANVGAPLTAENATANFTASYGVAFFHGSIGGFSGSNGAGRLAVDFDNGTLTGRFSNLRVNGSFRGGSNTLSGSVSYTHDRVSGRTFTAPLTGIIGVDGAIGTFVSNSNDYALGGGFIAND